MAEAGKKLTSRLQRLQFVANPVAAALPLGKLKAKNLSYFLVSFGEIGKNDSYNVLKFATKKALLYLLFVEQLVPALCLSSVAVLVPAFAAVVVLVVMRNCLLEMQLSQRSKSHWKQLNRLEPVLTIFPF